MMTLQHLFFNLSVPLLHHNKRRLFRLEPIGKRVRNVCLLQGQIVVEQIINHRELQVLLELLQRVLILGLLVHQVAHKVIVSLVQVAET